MRVSLTLEASTVAARPAPAVFAIAIIGSANKALQNPAPQTNREDNERPQGKIPRGVPRKRLANLGDIGKGREEGGHCPAPLLEDPIRS
jgi:hypothetical protein